MGANDPTRSPEPDEQDRAQWRTWSQAVTQQGVDEALRDGWRDVAQQITERAPTCWTSGKCCNFQAYGHRLYVTGLEVAWVLAQLRGATSSNDAATSSPQSSATQQRVVSLPMSGSMASAGGAAPSLPPPPTDPDTIDLQASCVFQVAKLCSIHAVRPLGCRVFFCQQGTEQWQQDLYEHAMNRLRALHETHALPYRYMEWRAALREAISVI